MKDVFNRHELVFEDRVDLDRILRWFPRRPTVKVLIVADTSVTFTSSFGIGKVIDIVRDNVDGYVRFEIDLARLGTQSSTLSVTASPGPKQAKYTNFRFSSQVGGDLVIGDYDEIWCFGFAPGNDGSPNDSNIWNSPYASTDQDLAVLTQWMNAGGGMLAMGDHHYLGAAMCARIPRVRSMRRWTNAQDVPPIGGPDRHDTHRPQNAGQDPNKTGNPAVIPFSAQGDDVPQKIDWRRYRASSFFFDRRYRPHPLLCGGELGVIDVLPDHAHEGWVYEDSEIDLAATYGFSGVTGDEYPSMSGAQPRPEAIAWARTLSDPPYNHTKGPSPAKRFAVIGAYDGDMANVGRVVVDSTWHHWMDVNLAGLEAESPDSEYQKIARYFRNCAVWLARKSQRSQMLTYTSFRSAFTAWGFEDLRIDTPMFKLGGSALDVLGRATSDCLVRDWIHVHIPVEFRERLLQHDFPLPDPCWSCPPIDVLEQAVLGGLMQEILPMRKQFERLYDDPNAELKVSDGSIRKAATVGIQKGLRAFQGMLKQNLEVLEGLTRLDVR